MNMSSINPFKLDIVLRWNFIFRLISIILLFTFFSGCAKEQKIYYIKGNFKDAFARANKENKKVFILITSSSCGNCENFEHLLNSQRNTVEILRKEYICFKADIENFEDRDIAKIVKCPSYPFPYFFNSDGRLLAFGFPKSEIYDISDLTKITIEQNRFFELFKMAISTKSYKDLISLTMKATLLPDQAVDSIASKARVLYKESLKIAPYPYNIRNYNLLSSPAQRRRMEEIISRYAPSGSDRAIYGDLNAYLKMDSSINRYKNSRRTKLEKEDFQVESSKNLGNLKQGLKFNFSFRLKNQSKNPLLINSVNHPCDCIKLSWPQDSVQLNQSVLITGSFIPYETGEFHKEIFIHTSSKQNPMKIINISGVVSN